MMKNTSLLLTALVLGPAKSRCRSNRLKRLQRMPSG